MPVALNKIVISFKLNKQTAFQYGQSYVALSRVRTLNSLLFLIGLNQSKLLKQIEVSLDSMKDYQVKWKPDLLLFEL